MLYDDNKTGGFPALNRYSAATNSTTVMAIHLLDFIKVIPQNELSKIIIENNIASLTELSKGEVY